MHRIRLGVKSSPCGKNRIYFHDEPQHRRTMKPATAQKAEVFRTKGVGVMRTSLDDIELGITMSPYNLELTRQRTSVSHHYNAPKSAEYVSPYIKIMLRKTADMLLYEQRSTTALLDSEEGQQVQADNALYAYLTEGKGRYRRTSPAETQTTGLLYKSRTVNTEIILKDHVASYVSNFEMFDTYQDLETTTESVQIEGSQQMEITTYRVDGVDEFIAINEMPGFKLALMLTMRILAGNIYEQQQRRFRNMHLPDPLATDVGYTYRIELLWQYKPQPQDDTCKAVADLSWCPRNGDILAVAYGIYSFTATHPMPTNGYVCVWNIKNPVNPERCYYYSVPVASVEFSPFVPQLLAIGLYDGSVEVRGITNRADPPVAVSQRVTSPSCEPVIAIKWIPHSSSDADTSGIQPFLALSQDGSVTKYRVISSPHLLGYQQIVLNRVQGSPEGIQLKRLLEHTQANRNPEGLNLALHPCKENLFFILTDEGCLHKCSTNFPHQHLDVLQAHETGVNVMDFCPWSPKLFLTCGNDWCIRVWMEGIVKPLFTLKNKVSPVHAALWSKTHSTVIVALNRETIDIWDIGRSTLKPTSSTNVDATFYTMFKFSNCGRSMALGNETGHVLMLSFEDMPFPPYYQYKALKVAIYKAIAMDPVLEKQVRSIGYFGYPKKKERRKYE